MKKTVINLMKHFIGHSIDQEIQFYILEIKKLHESGTSKQLSRYFDDNKIKIMNLLDLKRGEITIFKKMMLYNKGKKFELIETENKNFQTLYEKLTRRNYQKDREELKELILFEE